MKKFLLSSTALVGVAALAGPAQALDVTLGGYLETEVRFTSGEDEDQFAGRGYAFRQDTEIVLRVDGSTDAGLAYGAKVELHGESDSDGSGDGVENADEAVVFFSGGFGRIEIGNEDGAEDNMGLNGATVAAGTGGIDGSIPNGNSNLFITDSSDSTKFTYFTPRIAGFQLGFSYAPDTGDEGADQTGQTDDLEDTFGFGVNYTGAFAGLDGGLAFVGFSGEEEDSDDREFAYAVGGTLGFESFSLGASYGDDDFDDLDFISAGVAFGAGPANASVTYNFVDPDDDNEVNLFVVSGDVGIIPGVVLAGDIGYVDVDDEDEFFTGVVRTRLNF